LELNGAQDRQTRQDTGHWQVEDSQMMQRTKTGMIPHQLTQEDKASTPQPQFSQGGMSQEFGIPDESPWQQQDSPLRDDARIPRRPALTGAFYQDNVAFLAYISGVGERHKWLHAEFKLHARTFYQACMNSIASYFRVNEGGSDSEYVDLYARTDNRKKDVRKRSAAEVAGKRRKHR
jgi:hypothetical protein